MTRVGEGWIEMETRQEKIMVVDDEEHIVELVELYLADTGQGIEPELLPRIFERFYRVGKSRSTRRGGAGLGLSICKELVETPGGRIRVESLPGKGTTFTVTLPL